MTGILARGGCGLLLPPAMRPGLHQLGDESSPEVTSSSSPLGGGVALSAHSAHPMAMGIGGVISPTNSLGSSDIGDMDLELLDLDLNAYPHNTRQALGMRIPGFGNSRCSDTSESISGRTQPSTELNIRADGPIKPILQPYTVIF